MSYLENIGNTIRDLRLRITELEDARKPITAEDVTAEMIALVKKSTPMQGVVTAERIAAAYNAVNTRLTETKEGLLK